MGIDPKTLPLHIQEGMRRLQPQQRQEPRKSKRRGMNGLESSYAAYLQALKDRGEIKSWSYESVRLKLTQGGEKEAYFKPDFLVEMNDGRIEFHETKGFFREAAKVRIKVAAGMFPCFRFKVVRKIAGGFSVEDFR